MYIQHVKGKKYVHFAAKPLKYFANFRTSESTRIKREIMTKIRNENGNVALLQWTIKGISPHYVIETHSTEFGGYGGYHYLHKKFQCPPLHKMLALRLKLERQLVYKSQFVFQRIFVKMIFYFFKWFEKIFDLLNNKVSYRFKIRYLILCK